MQPKPSSPPEASQENSRRNQLVLAAKLRYELLTPVEAIVDYCKIILEDAQHGPEDFVADLNKMETAAQGLLTHLREVLLNSPNKNAGSGILLPFERHHIGNRLSQISGYCQLLLLDEHTQRFGAFLDDLTKIRGYCDECEQKLLGQVPAPGDDDSEDDVDGVIKSLPARPEDSVTRMVMPGTILVVDDNANNRDVLSRLLHHQGHHVVVAENGQQALGILEDWQEEQPIDLILMDVVMPTMNGLACLQRLKLDHRWRHIPVIMVSFFADLRSVLRCIEMGAEDYLPKPVDRVLLKVRVGTCLDKKRLRDKEKKYLKEIEAEKRFSDQLLHDLLPAPVVQELKKTKEVQARRYDHVAVLFADIVGFTTYCDQYEQAPEEVVKHLRGLVEVWDDIAQLHGIQKIKTIGDAFMAAGGLLTKLTMPVMSCVVCGLQMITATRKLPIGWNLRVGIHVGPVVAGVLGRRQNLFDLWGDTVNMAARMESNALPGGIALSQEAWNQVASRCRPVTPRQVQIKGKHLMDVYDFGGFVAEPVNQKPTRFPTMF